ncbi:MAG: hypothetical protein ACRDTA_19830 [Pseudonocardiaceae bacterium]
MSEPTSDALFGADGTQAPEPLPDPSSGRGSWRDAPALPPIPLLPVLDDSALRAAVAAMFDDDGGAPAEAAERDPGAVPDGPQAGADVKGADGPKTNGPKTNGPKTNGPSTEVPKPAPKANVPKVSVPAPARSAGVPAGRAAHTEAGGATRRPQVSALIPPDRLRPRRPAALRHRPPMAGASRQSMPGADLRRRIRREQVPLRSRSDGGATAFFLFMLIIMGLLIYGIVTSFLNFLSTFLP